MINDDSNEVINDTIRKESIVLFTRSSDTQSRHSRDMFVKHSLHFSHTELWKREHTSGGGGGVVSFTCTGPVPNISPAPPAPVMAADTRLSS